MPEINETQLQNWFQYHAPGPSQTTKYEAIRKAGLELARQILHNCPPGEDQAHAIREVRESVFTASAAIAMEGAATGRGA